MYSPQIQRSLSENGIQAMGEAKSAYEYVINHIWLIKSNSVSRSFDGLLSRIVFVVCPLYTNDSNMLASLIRNLCLFIFWLVSSWATAVYLPRGFDYLNVNIINIADAKI